MPAAEAGSTLNIHIGGVTAIQEDFSHILAQKMPQFVGVVVILAFLLLMVIFRSLLVPLVASVMNLLSIGAALGVMTAAFQWGWGKPLLGFTRAGPIEVFLPVLMFAILFGLSMDYEVFLVSRMHEEWVRTGDAQRSVTVGQAETGRVITAAALIMILVFLSFILGGQIVIKEVGLGFSAAIFVDAFVIRTVLVPSLMHVLGRSNWWLPKWLDRMLPRLHVEPEEITAAGPAPAPRRRGRRRLTAGPAPGRRRWWSGGIGQTDQVPLPLAPWPTIVNGRRVVAPDVDSIDARLRFDVAARQATGRSPHPVHHR